MYVVITTLGSTAITQNSEIDIIRTIFMHTKIKLLAVFFTLLLTSLVMAVGLEDTAKNNISDSTFSSDLLLFGVVGAALIGSQTSGPRSL